MIGYCTALAKFVEMSSVQTVRLADGTYVHQGWHTDAKGRKHLIYKKVYDRDIIVTENGKYIPAEVYAGDKTPPMLIEESNGQVVYKDGQKIEMNTKDGQAPETLDELKIKQGREVK